jgi:transposase-like protein
MDKAKKTPTTLLEAVSYFSDFENCKDYMVQLRWGKGKVTCPRCGSDNVSYLPNARVFKCYEKHSLAKFSLKVGTIFEDSPIPLEKWLPVMWMLVNCKNGVSSWEIHRAIGVTQKSAWFMLQRGRLAMQDELTGGMLNGEVEVDETYIGGKARNMHASRRRRGLEGGAGKTIVLGMLERNGRVRATVVPDRGKEVIQENVRGNIEAGSAIFSDEHARNWRMDDEYKHNVVEHAKAYVEGNVHTNGMENFWALLKRGLHGTYISVEPFHLFRYIDEQAFRFNNRGPMNDSQRFSYVMRKIVGKRLTYKGLIGKVQERPAEEEVEPF